jgi:hypothetical protein
MVTLYLDNFRGFHKTWLPLQDVNFFVGENSTGKTSVMSLVYLFATRQFWGEFDFSSDYNIGLGLFDEITREEEFTIGFVNDSPMYYRFFDEETGTVGKPYAVFMTLARSEDGTPKVKEYIGFTEGLGICLKANEVGNLFYNIGSPKYKKSKLIEFVKDWVVTQQPFDKKGYKQIEFDESLFSRRSIFSPSFVQKKGVRIDGIFHHIFSGRSSNLKKTIKGYSYLESIFDLNDFEILGSICWLAPVRSKPQRIYERLIRDFTPEGDHIPFLLRDLMQLDSPKAQKIRDTLNAFGRDSGLFEEIGVKRFGDDKYAPFEVQILLDGKPAKITNVGYGISQVLPLIVEILLHEKEENFALQQPEVHLHPKAQAFVGEFIFYQAKTEKQGFIVETHSDFILDRFRLAMKRDSAKPSDQTSSVKAQILFFERTENGNQIHSIEIAPDGSYLNEPPETFREFFINESLDVLGL